MTSNRQITFTYIPVVIIALLFVTPFVVSDKLYDGPIIAKEFWFLGVVALIILYNAIRLLIRKEKIKIRLDLPDILLLAFFIWGLINAIFITPYTPFFYNHKLQLLSGCVVVYFFIKSVIRYEINENDEENGKSVGSKNNSFFFSLFIFLFIISGLLQAVYGLLQLYGVCSSNHYLFKTTGSFYHPAPYALYLAVVFPMAMGVVIKNGKFITTHVQRNDNKIGSFIRQLYQFLVLNSSFLIYYLAVTTFIAILLVLPATMIRAAWVGAFVGSVVVLWYAIRRGIINKPNWIKNMLATTTKRVILIGLGIVLLGLASIFLYKVKEGSSEGRTFIWKVTKEKMAEKPFNGVGLGRFKAEYNIWQANWFASGNGTKREEMLAGNVVFAYNEFLEITVELGIIGLLLFFSFAFSPLMNIENYSGNNKSGSSLNYYFHKFLFLIGLITLLTSSLFSYPFYSLPTFILLFVFIALLSQRKKDIYSVSIKRLIKYLIVFFLIVSVVLFSI